MRNYFLTILLFFPTLLLANNPIESDTTRIGSTFTDHSVGLDSNHEPQKTFLSSDFLYFTATSGFSPKSGSYSPGLRINFGTALFVKELELKTSYTRWGYESKQHKIDKSFQHDSIEAKIGKSFQHTRGLSTRLFLGIEGIKQKFSFKNKTYNPYEIKFFASKSESRKSLSIGPLIGLELDQSIGPFFKLLGAISGTYSIGEHYSTWGSCSLYKPNAKTKLGFEFTSPTGIKDAQISLSGSYEMQLYWASITPYGFSWSHPANIQGFSAEVRCDF